MKVGVLTPTFDRTSGTNPAGLFVAGKQLGEAAARRGGLTEVVFAFAFGRTIGPQTAVVFGTKGETGVLFAWNKYVQDEVAELR